MTLEQKARWAAKRVGLIARKSRRGFMLLDERDRIVVGARLTPKEIIDLCPAAFNYVERRSIKQKSRPVQPEAAL